MSDLPEIRIDIGTDHYGFSGPMYLAEIDILGGQRKAAGLGRSEREAVMNLARWLAGAATDFDLKFDEDEAQWAPEIPPPPSIGGVPERWYHEVK